MPLAPNRKLLAQRMDGLRSSAIRDLLRAVGRPDVISLAGGLPAPELFPRELFERISGELFRSSEGEEALQYGSTEGLPALRRRLASRAPFPAGTFDEAGVLVTQGSQQGLDLAAKVFLDPGDEVLVETPAYVGALQVLRFFGARVTFLPCDADGVDPDALRLALRRNPKLLYLTPTFQNPSGLDYPEQRRRDVAAVLEACDTILLEDDPYRELWYDAAPPLPVGTYVDPSRRLYLGTASKIAAPGLRIGWVLGPTEWVGRFALAKQPTDLCTGALGQHLLLRLLDDPGFEPHLVRLRDAYRRRRDALEAALHRQLAEHLSWARPGGGLFLWARLAGGGDAGALLELALREGVAFVPGGEFHPEGQGTDTLRLNFSYADEGRLQEGVARLARAFRSRSGLPPA
jgi:2-aminoadipate transaminase